MRASCVLVVRWRRGEVPCWAGENGRLFCRGVDSRLLFQMLTSLPALHLPLGRPGQGFVPRRHRFSSAGIALWAEVSMVAQSDEEEEEEEEQEQEGGDSG